MRTDIRPIDDDAFSRLSDFYRLCFDSEYAPLYDDDLLEIILEYASGDAREDIVGPGDTAVVALCASRGTRIVGTAVFSRKEAIAYLWGLYVDPRELREGVGSALVRRVVELLEDTIVLEVMVLDRSRKACSFYAALGFVTIDRMLTEVFPGIPDEVLTMRCAVAVCRDRLSELGSGS